MSPHDPAAPAWPSAELRRLEILSARLVTSLFAGEYRSVFRGRGIEFEEVREYQPGDDVRSIDWNVTARAGRPFIKQYVEEREMSVMLLLDQSASLNCATPRRGKSRVAAEVCALLSFAAARSHDRVGMMTFTDRVERYLPPGKGMRHAQRLMAEVLVRTPTGQGTDLAQALDYLERVLRRSSTLFIISDFLAGDFRLPLVAAARRHDVVAVFITDALDEALPDVGLMRVEDAETGRLRLIDTSAPRVRKAFREQAMARRQSLRQALASAGVEVLSMDTATSTAQTLVRFFQGRRQRLSR